MMATVMALNGVCRVALFSNPGRGVTPSARMAGHPHLAGPRTRAGRQSPLQWSVAGTRPMKRDLARLRMNAVPIAETAAMTLQVAGLLFRAATAGAFVYATLQWKLLRGLRKKVENVIEDKELADVARQKRLRRFEPPSSSKPDEKEM